MTTLLDLMGLETYNLIYKHLDQEGNEILDMEDVLYCEDDEIDEARIEKLAKLLLIPKSSVELQVGVEAAKLLAAGGVREAIDFFEFCVNERVDRKWSFFPDRLYGYDVIYEQISDAILNYLARYADRSDSEGETELLRVTPLLKNILTIAGENPFSLSWILPSIKKEEWKVFSNGLVGLYRAISSRQERFPTDEANLADLEEILLDWDLDHP